MIILPTCSQDPSPSRQINYSYIQKDSSPHISELRRHVAGAMLSVMPSSIPSEPKRPKLSLQTPKLSSPAVPRSAPVTTESLAIRNTHSAVFEDPPPTQTSVIQPQIRFPSSSNTSPFHSDAPYVLPIGTHSILRNSPLPGRHVSAATTRPPRWIFPPRKRVAFQERLAEFMPTPVIEGVSDTEADNSSSEDDRKRRREAIQAEDGHSTTIHARSKRRDWVWRQVEDDVSTSRDLVFVRNEPEIPMD